jgi:nicotinate-nucleotide adenylyltransferase
VLKLPLALPGQSVGLFGGSFDPPHKGHQHVAKSALKMLGLDQIWWMVSPGNPLKKIAPAPMTDRMNACRDLATHPAMHVSDIEAQLGTHTSADLLSHLLARRADLNFVWIMGADNLEELHQWADWQAIMESVPVAVFARPGYRIASRFSPAAQTYRSAFQRRSKIRLLKHKVAPAWGFVNLPMIDISSTQLRNRPNI